MKTPRITTSSTGQRIISTEHDGFGTLKLSCLDVFLGANKKWTAGSHYDQAFADRAVKGLAPGKQLPWPRILLDQSKKIIVKSAATIPEDLPAGPYLLGIEIC